MNTAYNTFAQAMNTIEHFHSEGYKSFKLFKENGMWYIEVKA